jgi:hypothetical protein
MKSDIEATCPSWQQVGATVKKNSSLWILRFAILSAVLISYGCVWKRTIDYGACNSIGPQLSTPTTAAPRNEINVLTLSAGGPWGAFGAGFLKGWSDIKEPANSLRPKFDIALGVSTGATMVTHAFLGTDYDTILRDQVRSLSTRQVFQARPVLMALLGDSVTDTSPLRRTLERVITDEIIDKVADAWLKEGRRIAVISVDLDCGNPEILDLTAVALQRNDPSRSKRYIDFLMASAASPVAFPPVFIDGHMMVDGALRQHVPFPHQIAELLPANHNGEQRQINLYAIINSPLETYPQCVTDHVVTIALRTSEIWTGERAVDSIALTVLDAQRRGWIVRYVASIDAPCAPIPSRKNYFEQPFMQCQYDYGYSLGVAEQSPWRNSVDDLPPPDAIYGPHPCRK